MADKNRRTKLVVISVLLGVILGLVIALNFNFTQNGFAGDEAPAPENTTAKANLLQASDLEKTSRAFVEIAKRVTPTVVSITSEKVVKVRDPFSGFFNNDDFFRRFFRRPDSDRQDQEYKQRGLGSGVIVSPDGYILTNYHVIKDADEINVVIDKKPYDAEVVGTDPATDIAVVKIEESNLKAITIGDSDALEVGEWVLAIGSPFDLSLQHSVTSGIISAKGRALNLSGELTYQDFIQTDAAINPGNSGGALVNIKGELIGINTAIYAGNAGGNIGIGFAVPVNLAKQVLDDLIEHGEVVRGYLGVFINSLDPELSAALKIDDNEGAVVTQVVEGTPAAKAGLQEYDVIVEVDGRKIRGHQSLTNIIAAYQPTDKVKLKIIRDGKAKYLEVVLERRPSGNPNPSPPLDKPDQSNKMGLELRNLTESLAERYGYQDEEGVLVAQVEQNSVAAEKGMRPGDLIVEVDRRRIKSLEQFRSIADGFKAGQIVLFQIKRGKGNHFIAIKVPE